MPIDLSNSVKYLRGVGPQRAAILEQRGISTVAECVESEAVLEELKRIGVDFAQGFFVAAPLPIAQLTP